MKKTIVFFATIFLFAASQAQMRSYEKALNLNNQKVSLKKDNTLDVNFSLDTKSLDIPSRQSLTLVPVIKDSLGNQLSLPEIWINGSNRQKVYKRMQSLHKDQDLYKNAYAVVGAKDKASGNIDYHTNVPYAPWMRNASLYLQEDQCGCGNARASINERYLGKIAFPPTIHYQPKAHVAFIVPQAETVKNRNESSEAYLDFEVGRYKILPEFRRNPAELAKVNDMLKQAMGDKNVTISSISFIGKASPEGSFESNRKLAQNRATSLQDYIKFQHNISSNVLKSEALGEDWATFRKLVSESNMTQQSEILNIIDSNDAPDKKESRLKLLNNGMSFKQMNQEIFPQLRRVECRIDYTVRAFSAEEGKEIIKTHPQQLSLNEMFLVANTYTKGSEGFNQVFDVAVRMFPQNDVANNNAAAAAILAGDLLKGRSYIEKCKMGGEYYNNLGVLSLLQGDLAKAEEYLTKAKAAGVKEADNNFEELRLKKADNELFESFNH